MTCLDLDWIKPRKHELETLALMLLWVPGFGSAATIQRTEMGVPGSSYLGVLRKFGTPTINPQIAGCPFNKDPKRAPLLSETSNTYPGPKAECTTGCLGCQLKIG